MLPLIQYFDIEVVMWNALLFYGGCVRNIQATGKKIYDAHPWIRTCVDVTKYSLGFAYATMIHMRMEPLTTTWLATSVIEKSMHFVEFYEYETDFGNDDDDLITIALTQAEELYAVDDTIDGLVILRNGNDYLCRIPINKVVKNREILPSRVRFLSVEYRHLDMEEPIILDIPTGFYLVDNEILSSVFVKRCLEYQPKQYIFDLNYTLHLIDNNIQESILTSKDYIFLEQDHYSIQRKVYKD